MPNPLEQKGAKDKPLIDLEGAIKQHFDISAKAYSYQTQPLKVKESIINERELKRHKRIMGET